MKMKAFGINQYGNSHVMQEYQLPTPKISADEVLVKTSAFAINAFDISVRNGTFRDSVTLLFPFILGSDAIGRIVKVGKNVNNYHIGDDVMAHPGLGTYAEYFKVSSTHLGLIPNNADPNTVAGLPLSGITAYNVLVHSAQVQSGQTIVILGAAGGVGSLLVQMAKAMGLYVIGTDISSAKERVLANGADEFGGYDDESVRQKFSRVADVLIDATNNGAGGKAGIEIIKDNGTYVSLTILPTNAQTRPNVFFKQVVPNPKYLDSDAFFAISLMIRNNQLHVPVDRVKSFSLNGIIEGQDLVENNLSDGKVIIKI